MKTADNTRYVYLMMLLSPVLAIYLSIANLNWEQRKWILIIITTLFGSTIILQTSDGSVLLQMIYDHYVGLSFKQWLFELKEIIVFSPEPGTKGDIFSHVFSYLFGEVLRWPGLYFTFVSFVYGYFFITALSNILRWNTTTEKSILFWAIIIIFISYRFVDNLQTVRTWTGLWILVNGVYGFHNTRKFKYILLMLFAPMLHLAYFAIATPAVVMVSSRWISSKLIILIYAVSFFLVIDEKNIISQLETTDLGEEKVAGYYRENPDDYLMDTSKAGNWYREYGKGMALTNAPHVLAISVILMGLFSKYKMTSAEHGLFSTGLAMAILANVGDFVPAFYTRTMVNAGIMILASTVLLLVRNELLNAFGWFLIWRKLLLWGSVICFAPYFVYVLANMIQFTSIFMLGIPVFGVFADFNISIRELIRLLAG